MKVDEECSKLLEINTHKGLFKLSHFPLGLNVTPSLFQQVNDAILAGLEFTTAYLDGILLMSGNNEQHRKHIKSMF